MTKSSLALTLGNISIRQLDGLFSLNDLHKASGSNPSQRPGNFLGIDQTKALIAEIETAEIPAVTTREGRNGGTYACRELVIAYAAWISATFHLKVNWSCYDLLSSLDGRNQRRNSRAHLYGQRLFSFPNCSGRTASFLVGHVEASKGALVPLASPSTLRGLPPILDGLGGRFKTCSKGANHG